MATSEPQRITLSLLGPLTVWRDGRPVPLPSSKKTRALLGYLAAADRPARREQLCTLFWEVPDDPRGALRWSLSKLRGAIEDGTSAHLIADRDAVALDHAAIDVDWRALRTLATADVRKAVTGELDAALGEDGAFMEGLDLPACETYQAWLVALREDSQRYQVTLLREIVGRDGDPRRRLGFARRWSALDPYDAIARTALIELLERDGRTAEAEQERAMSIRALEGAQRPVPAALRDTARRPPPDDAADPPQPPQQVRFCVANDGTGLAYSAVGDGPPLVKTANWLNHLEHDWESPVWRHWIRHFLGYRCLIRYDERGNGLSDWNAREIGFEAFVEDLSTVVEAAGLDRFDLLGISQGCSVAIAYAVRNPGRVRKLVLYGGYAAGWKVRASPEEMESRQAMITLTRTGWGRSNSAFRQLFTSLFFPDASPEQTEWFNELQRMSASADNAIRLQEAFSTIDVRGDLARVDVPTLVLHTTGDAVVPFTSGRHLATRIPGAQFVQLDSRNHMVLEHEPAWPRAAEAIKAFLDADRAYS